MGDGSIITIMIPPNKNKPPTNNANTNLNLGANHATKYAPTNVPKAWAKNGERKWMGPYKCILSTILFTSAGFTPAGGGINCPPK